MSISINGTTLTFNDGTTQTSAAGFASTTAMIFQQTSAPTGWTKVTTYNDYALRIVSGAASTGGSVAFTTAFASGLSAGSTTLTTTTMPSHSHGFSGSSIAIYDGGSCALSKGIYNTTYSTFVGITSTGSSASHNHSLPSFAVQYVDTIIATKN